MAFQAPFLGCLVLQILDLIFFHCQESFYLWTILILVFLHFLFMNFSFLVLDWQNTPFWILILLTCNQKNNNIYKSFIK